MVRLRKPLVPADADAEAAVARAPYAEAGVAGGEVELLVIAGALRDVRLAVDAQYRAVGVDHHQAVEVGVVRTLEHGHRQHDAEIRREAGEAQDGWILGHRGGQLEVTRQVILAEVRRLEELLNEYHLGPSPGRLAHQPLRIRDVRLAVPAAGHLGRRHRHLHGQASVVVTATGRSRSS
jgi:hypothetical protein